MDRHHNAIIYIPDLANFLASNLSNHDLRTLVLKIEEEVAEEEFTRDLFKDVEEALKEWSVE